MALHAPGDPLPEVGGESYAAKQGSRHLEAEMAEQAESPIDKLPGGRQVRALHGAIEHSLAIQTNKLQQTIDDFVARGKLSREDAEELVGQLLASGQGFSKGLLEVIDSAVADARKGAGGAVGAVSSTVGSVLGQASGAAKRVTGQAGWGRSRR